MDLKNVITILGFGNFKFNNISWQKSPGSRKCFVKHIISDQIAIGMNEKKVADTFGLDRKVYSRGVWSYHVPTITFGKGEQYLNIYFDENGIAYSSKIIFRKKIKYKKKPQGNRF